MTETILIAKNKKQLSVLFDWSFLDLEKNVINEKYIDKFSIEPGKIENTFLILHKDTCNYFILDKTKKIFTLEKEEKEENEEEEEKEEKEEEEEEEEEEKDLKMQTGIFDFTPSNNRLNEDECFYSTKCIDPC